MIDTPNTFWNPAANTASHNSGLTSADSSRPRWRENRTSSRMVTALKARATCTSVISSRSPRTSPVSPR